MGGTGKVVTTAGLVFAFTMASMIVSDVRVVGQVGTTIGLGLLFDTLIVRAFLTPSIAALLGRWFWWPLNVRQRAARGRSSAASPDKMPAAAAANRHAAPVVNGRGTPPRSGSEYGSHAADRYGFHAKASNNPSWDKQLHR
jgi:RND superfamily putative drug exporter